MTTPATEQNPVGISTEDTPANRAALRVALLTMGCMVCVGGEVQDGVSSIESQREIAEETGLPYVSVRLALFHFADSGLLVADLNEWDAAAPWVREVTREAVAELTARHEAEEAARS